MAIGTTAAILGAAAVGTAGTVAAGAMSSSAANKAAQAQTQAARRSQRVQQNALDFQERVYEENVERSQPWYEAGVGALDQYLVEMGMAEGESRFQETPGYQFAVDQGERGVTNNLSALGMKNSGAALKALTEFRTGLANQEFGTYMNRLGQMAGAGQTQANATNQMGTSTGNSLMAGANSIGNTMQQAGAARASGYIGQANALGGAITGVTNNVSNALGMMAYANPAMSAFPPAPAAGFGTF